ncbi:hypothetical protein PaG_04700 [Moesziomyces aphidis]|uniref:Uncharacterized protein n=1 Tax=Moesziomyces aphidis TaxID=84754 RepID=W3VGM1_MOEAP|nr:hypothetical protein PaG_04700 [Moesziomyces aphidis]
MQTNGLSPPTPPLCLAASPSRLSRSVGRSEILSQKATSALPWERGGGIAARARNPMEFEMADDSRKTQAWPLRPVKGAATPRGRQTDEVQDPRVSFKVPHNVEGASGDGRERKSGRRSSERAGRASKIRASEQHSIKHVAGLSLGKTTWSVSPLIIGGCLSDARGPRYAGQ